eukprot:TRINITY_DN10587_c0_g1_i1.p1 TRINITY_DN10587_c0_g1~~TRINITY_DN10587_c0_g1_i1.p1  ORF type:complete len:160 (-),score=28.35 TRINITY_DN10587_c0_g1_i1:217-696(-)
MLVASVMFHISVTSQTPPTQTLTFADVLLLNVYGFELVSFIITIVLIRLKRIGDTRDENDDQSPTAHLAEYAAEFLHHWSEVVVWVVVPLYLLMGFIIQVNWWVVITTQILVAVVTAAFLVGTKRFGINDGKKGGLEKRWALRVTTELMKEQIVVKRLG